MRAWKKIVAAVVTVSLVGAASNVGLRYIRKSREKKVIVVPVESLASDYYMEDTTLDGTITTNVSQKITMDKDMVVDNLYVSLGDTVKKGDPLVSFDMTLVEMELNIARLKLEKLEQDLTKARKRLNSLRNGGPIDDDTYVTDADSLSFLNDEDDLAAVPVLNDDVLMAYTFRPFLLAAQLQLLATEDGFTEEIGETAPTEEPLISERQETPAAEETDIVPEPVEYPTTTESPGTVEEPQPSQSSEEPENPQKDPQGGNPNDSHAAEPVDPWSDPDSVTPADGSGPGSSGGEIDDFSLGETDFTFLPERFYQILDENSIPYQGNGTEKDPYLFLCSSAAGKVRAMGSFLNKMAGFSADGTAALHPGGYWYLLEFYENDKIDNPFSRKDSCIGYYLIDGGLLSDPVSMFAEVEYTLEEALTYETEEEEEDPADYYDDSGDTEPSMSRAEAIRSQQNRVRSLELDIEEGEISIRKLEKKMEKQEVKSRLDGTVIAVGDPVTGSTDSNGTFLTIKSKEGFYVRGSIGELMLDQITIGTKVNCTSYSVGDFEAEVMDISDYPEDSHDSYFYGGDSNPNVSYYSFSASIEDQSMEFSDGDWIQITLKSDASQSGKLVISKAFVRSENGMNYVYKDDGGVLKKTYIQVGKTVDGGYSVMIQGGLSRRDKIAFPYGNAVKDGIATKEGTEDDLYDY